MNKSIKQEEFNKFKRAINISIDNLGKKIHELTRPSDIPATKREVLLDRNMNNAKFDAIEQAIDLIFSILESHDMNIITCMHCKQPLPKANNDN